MSVHPAPPEDIGNVDELIAALKSPLQPGNAREASPSVLDAEGGKRLKEPPTPLDVTTANGNGNLIAVAPSPTLSKSTRFINRDGMLLSREDESITAASWWLPALWRILSGAFLSIGDYTCPDQRSSMIEENNVVALGSALMLTCQVALFYSDWQIDPSSDTERLVSIWGEEWANRFQLVKVPIQLGCSAMFTCSIMMALQMILAVNEMSGEGEVLFSTFLLALFLFLVWLLVWCVAYYANATQDGRSVALVVTFLVVFGTGILYFPGMVTLVQAMYAIKADGDVIAPLCLSTEEVRKKLNLFVEILGDPMLVNKGNFEQWLVEVCRDSIPTKLSTMTNRCCTEEIHMLYMRTYRGAQDHAPGPKKEFKLSEWLEHLRLGGYLEVFKEQELTEESTLQHLTDDHLKELKVSPTPHIGHRTAKGFRQQPGIG
ncbi:hypothetical protein T484DRAFT_1934045 [Baffinella frigidus]|nr:hypothetical protein T484DRAFT_1934045 [Cryptophyta sp. CCMP2293]